VKSASLDQVELSVDQVTLVRSVHRVRSALLETAGHRDSLDRLGLRELQEHKVLKVHKDQLETRDLPDSRASKD